MGNGVMQASNTEVHKVGSYEQFEHWYQDRSPQLRDLQQQVRQQLETALAGVDRPVEIRSRIKRPDSAWNKMLRDRLAPDEVHDLVGFRVLVDYVDECYEVMENLRRRFRGRCERTKDYIASPKPNGYQSLHTCVRTPQGERVEVQIRTRAMDRRCRDGVVAHWRYKTTHTSLAS